MKIDATPTEQIIEPELPIVDAHHHLWLFPEGAAAAMEASGTVIGRGLAPVLRRHGRYLFDDFRADLDSGHNVRASVFVDAHAMYRLNGPDAMKSVGEVEFVNGVAAMSASGLFGDALVCAGIVGGIDLSLGDAVEDVLVAHIQAGGGRYRGVRSSVSYDEDPTLLGGDGKPHLLLDPEFRAGFRRLQPLGLSFDALVLEPQLPDLVDLASAFPETQIVLEHTGAPVGVGRYGGQSEERFPIWRDNIRALSRCPNVAIKLGGFGIPFGGFESFLADPPFSSEQLAAEWKPYIESCIEAFGTDRCMFESNFPVDSSVASYAVLWNAFKRAVADASISDKTALFAGTAILIYRLEGVATNDASDDIQP